VTAPSYVAANTATYVPMDVAKGSYWAWGFPILDTAGNPVTVVSAQAQIRSRDGIVRFEFTGTNLALVASGSPSVAASQVNLRIPSAASTLWDWSSARWSLEVTTGGETYRICDGPVSARDETTR